MNQTSKGMAKVQGEVRIRDNSKAIRIGNLPPDADEEDLELITQRCRGITEMYLAKDHNGKFKGFGYIHFKTKRQVKDALYSLNGLNYNKRGLTVARATS